jgi:hypothetical protein
MRIICGAIAGVREPAPREETDRKGPVRGEGEKERRGGVEH